MDYIYFSGAGKVDLEIKPILISSFEGDDKYKKEATIASPLPAHRCLPFSNALWEFTLGLGYLRMLL